MCDLAGELAMALQLIGREQGAARASAIDTAVWQATLQKRRQALLGRWVAYSRWPSAETERRLRETLESWHWLYRDVRSGR